MAPWDTTLYESERYFIAPTRGALIPGWLLVVSKRHALCSGAATLDESRELRDCLEVARKMVRTSFFEPTIFEHGPSHAGSPLGCGVDHLHIHVAPLNFSLKTAVSAQFPATEWKSLPDISYTKTLFSKGVGYGLIQEPKQNIYWCTPPVGVRQFLRRAIASEIGKPDQFDYAAYPQILNVNLTLKALAPQLP
jgi:diadenosine tetraphosphate (Ap4A) HIT family hydrolase